MSLQNLQIVLEETFSANFVSYYKSHVAHVNIVGRNFASDHKLLQKIYEYFQETIDIIAEKIRTVKGTMPNSLETILELSTITDSPTVGNSIALLETVEEAIEAMIDQYHEVNDAAEAINYIDISNFAQDQIGQLARFRWMLQATLEERGEE